MAECQICGTAVIVPRPIEIDDGIWLLVCNKCFQKQSPKVSIGPSH